MRGKKTGGRRPRSKNKATLRREAIITAGVAAIDGSEVDPRAIPTLTRVMKYFLDRAEEEMRKKDGGDPKVISASLLGSSARRNLCINWVQFDLMRRSGDKV
jgi:hypothetical protein